MIRGIIKQIHSEGDKFSSKRVYGGLLIIAVIVAVFARIESAILEPMLYTGAGLIGLGTTVAIARAVNNKQDEGK